MRLRCHKAASLPHDVTRAEHTRRCLDSEFRFWDDWYSSLSLTRVQAGAVAAFTIDLLVYPLDTLKTRFQSQNYSKLYLDPKTGAVNRALLTRGLYQGVGSVILATLPSCTSLFQSPVYPHFLGSFSELVVDPV